MRPLAVALALLFLLGCERSSPLPDGTEAIRSGSRALVVYTVNYPLAYFAERIGGETVDVKFPAPAGVDPAHWSPAPDTILGYQAADLVLLNGAGYAAWTGRASLRRDRLVDTSAAVRGRLIRKGSPAHQHGPTGEHSHGEFAVTTWLDPMLAMAQARAIAAALEAARPEQRAVFESGLASLEADLRALDARLVAAARALGNRPLLVSHPVYQYLIARYGMNGRTVVFEPHSIPSERQWQALATLLEDHPADHMLWEAEPTAEIRERLRGLGIESHVYAPLGNRPSAGDFLSVMTTNATGLADVASR